MAAQTWLTRIAPTLATPEEVAVEALFHILSSSAAARHALGDTLRTSGVEGSPIVRAETRSAGDNGERRTLAAFDAQGAERVSIDARFWGGQAAARFESPPPGRPAVLLFVVPAARLVTFWSELRKSAETTTGPSRSDREEPWSTTASGGRRLMLISWMNLLDRLSGLANAAGETQAELDIRQLRGLAKQHEETNFLPLRSEELGPRFPRRMLSLIRLINDVTARVRSKGWELKPYVPHRAGWYVPLRRSGLQLRFGIDLGLWARHGRTPLWLTVHESGNHDPDSVTIDEARRRLESLLVDADAWPPSVPIRLPERTEYDRVRDEVVRQVEDIADGIARSPNSRL